MRIPCLLLLLVVLLSACKKELVEDFDFDNLPSVLIESERFYYEDPTLSLYRAGAHYTVTYYKDGEPTQVGDTWVNSTRMDYDPIDRNYTHSIESDFRVSRVPSFSVGNYAHPTFSYYDYYISATASIPLIGYMSAPNSINTNSSFILNISQNDHSDSTYFEIGPVLIKKAGNPQSCTFSRSELAMLTKYSYYPIKVTGITHRKNVINGIEYVLTQREVKIDEVYIY
jgi:hypothetical protein